MTTLLQNPGSNISMKRIYGWIVLVAVSTAAFGQKTLHPNVVAEHFQKGLLEEEANHNLKAAIQAYEAALPEIQSQRQIGAAVRFHLGQSYFKLGRTNEARAQFERLVIDYPEQHHAVAPYRKLFPSLSIHDPAFKAGIASLESKVAGERTTLEMLQRKSGPALAKELMILAPDAGLQKLLNDHNQADSRLAEAASRYKDLHPEMIRLRAVQNNLASQLSQKADEILSALRLKLKVGESSLESMKASIARETAPGQPKPAAPESPQTSTAREIDSIRALFRDSPDLINPSLMENQISNNAIDVVAYLLENGFEVDRRGSNNRTSLHYAVSRGRKSIAQLLLDRGAQVDAEDDNAQTPLFLAASQGYRSLTELLLKRGADPLKSDRVGRTPLHEAASQGNLLDLFLLKHLDWNIRDRSGRTPLHAASTSLRKPEALQLLARGADVNLASSGGLTPLNAVLSSHDYFPAAQDIVKLLLDHGANPSLADRDGQTPLHHAVRKWNLSTVELLLEKKAQMNAVDVQGFSPTFHALSRGREDIALFLMERGGEFVLNNNLRNKIQTVSNPTLRERLTNRELLSGNSATNFQMDPALLRRYGLTRAISTPSARIPRASQQETSIAPETAAPTSTEAKSTTVRFQGPVRKTELTLPSDLPKKLSEALDEVETTEFANLKKVTLFRSGPNGGEESASYDISAIKSGSAEDPVLKPGDRVVVSEKILNFK